MPKCRTDFKGCCCNFNGECFYWGSCSRQVFENENVNINEIIESKELDIK